MKNRVFILASFALIFISAQKVLLPIQSKQAILKYDPPFQNGLKVEPVHWADFRKGSPKDSLSLMERDILLNSNKYAVTTWYNEVKNFNKQSGNYLDFGGNNEENIRPSASEAFALAVSLKTHAYNPHITGVPAVKARLIALKLIRSLAWHHKANLNNGWGNSWQSALWAAYSGAAAWLMWNDLSLTDKLHVSNMVVYEANRFDKYEVPYYKDKEEKVIFNGDSKSEENAWNAMVLQVAIAMMPGHPNKAVWMKKNIELMISANARPEDVSSPKIINGIKLSSFLNGSNVNSDGTITNHGIIHPDYMSCTSETFFNALMFTLAGKPTPISAFFNTDLIYKAMVDENFPTPEYVSPGGTMYVEDSDKIYYPQNTDWGKGRRMTFALMDCQMNAFHMDTLASLNGKYWERLHAQAALDMQKRSDDGRTYQSANEDVYPGREEWVAVYAAQAYLTKWLLHQDKFYVTNK